MRIGIVGAGAIGSVVEGLLTKAGLKPDPAPLEPLTHILPP